MSNDKSLGFGARLAVAALVLLGTAGAALIVAGGEFSTSPKHGGTPIIVTGPEAYVMASIMYSLSVLAVLTLVRAAVGARRYSALALCIHGLATAGLVWWMA